MRIVHQCVITDNRITVNGRTVFEQDPKADFTDFAKAAFKYSEIAYPKFYKMDKLCKLGFLAAEYLFAENPDCHPNESSAIVLAGSSGSTDVDLIHLENIREPSPAVFVYTLPNIVIGEIAIRHGIKGENVFFVCERPDHPIREQYVALLSDNGIAETFLSGWVEYTNEHYLADLVWMTDETR